MAPFLFFSEHNNKFFEGINELYNEKNNKIDDKINCKLNENIKYKNYNQTELDILKKKFFDQNNVNLIQQQIQYNVKKFDKWHDMFNINENIFKNKPFLIPKQNDKHIFTLMDHFYNYYSFNFQFDFDQQIEYLNKIVVDFAVEKIIKSIVSKLKYLYDRDHIGQGSLINPIKITKWKKTLPSFL